MNKKNGLMAKWTLDNRQSSIVNRQWTMDTLTVLSTGSGFWIGNDQ